VADVGRRVLIAGNEDVGRRVLILTASVEEMVGGGFTMATMGQHGDGTITAERTGDSRWR
jgi:hypothetical protein